ncbi:hypothetical protein V3C99_004273 [Haemonchus contortus]
MLLGFKQSSTIARHLCCGSQLSLARALTTNPYSHHTTDTQMVVRRIPRRSARKSFSEHNDRRSAKKFLISEHPIALLPPRGHEEEEEYQFHVPYPKEIVKYLDKFVIGQELAKRTLAVGVYQHYKRLKNNTEIQNQEILKNVVESAVLAKEKNRNEKDQDYDDFFDGESPPPPPRRKTTFERLEEETPLTMDKSNIVLLGPSGSGKTYLTQCLARLLDVPIAMCDCTTLTQAGYVGEDVETVIQKLLVNAHGSVERAQQGIVFLDEFDKIHSSSDPIHSVGNRDVSGRGVQQALLKLVEGTVAKVKLPGQMGQKVDVDTTDILFIASGAFSKLEQIVARRIDQRVLGFGTTYANLTEDLSSNDETIAAEKRNEVLKQTEPSDLIQFGMVPELVGRFPVLVPFHALDEKMLIRVLEEPRNSLISQAQRFFAMDNIQLRFTREAINELARRAAQRKTGARALRSILENVLLQAKFECPGTGVQTVVITGATVRGESDYMTSDSNSDSIVPTDLPGPE